MEPPPDRIRVHVSATGGPAIASQPPLVDVGLPRRGRSRAAQCAGDPHSRPDFGAADQSPPRVAPPRRSHSLPKALSLFAQHCIEAELRTFAPDVVQRAACPELVSVWQNTNNDLLFDNTNPEFLFRAYVSGQTSVHTVRAACKAMDRGFAGKQITGSRRVRVTQRRQRQAQQITQRAAHCGRLLLEDRQLVRLAKKANVRAARMTDEALLWMHQCGYPAADRAQLERQAWLADLGGVPPSTAYAYPAPRLSRGSDTDEDFGPLPPTTKEIPAEQVSIVIDERYARSPLFLESKNKAVKIQRKGLHTRGRFASLQRISAAMRTGGAPAQQTIVAGGATSSSFPESRSTTTVEEPLSSPRAALSSPRGEQMSSSSAGTSMVSVDDMLSAGEAQKTGVLQTDGFRDSQEAALLGQVLHGVMGGKQEAVWDTQAYLLENMGRFEGCRYRNGFLSDREGGQLLFDARPDYERLQTAGPLTTRSVYQTCAHRMRDLNRGLPLRIAGRSEMALLPFCVFDDSPHLSPLVRLTLPSGLKRSQSSQRLARKENQKTKSDSPKPSARASAGPALSDPGLLCDDGSDDTTTPTTTDTSPVAFAWDRPPNDEPDGRPPPRPSLLPFSSRRNPGPLQAVRWRAREQFLAAHLPFDLPGVLVGPAQLHESDKTQRHVSGGKNAVKPQKQLSEDYEPQEVQISLSLSRLLMEAHAAVRTCVVYAPFEQEEDVETDLVNLYKRLTRAWTRERLTLPPLMEQIEELALARGESLLYHPPYTPPMDSRRSMSTGPSSRRGTVELLNKVVSAPSGGQSPEEVSEDIRRLMLPLVERATAAREEFNIRPGRQSLHSREEATSSKSDCEPELPETESSPSVLVPPPTRRSSSSIAVVMQNPGRFCMVEKMCAYFLQVLFSRCRSRADVKALLFHVLRLLLPHEREDFVKALSLEVVERHRCRVAGVLLPNTVPSASVGREGVGTIPPGAVQRSASETSRKEATSWLMSRIYPGGRISANQVDLVSPVLGNVGGDDSPPPNGALPHPANEPSEGQQWAYFQEVFPVKPETSLPEKEAVTYVAVALLGSVLCTTEAMETLLQSEGLIVLIIADSVHWYQASDLRGTQRLLMRLFCSMDASFRRYLVTLLQL